MEVLVLVCDEGGLLTVKANAMDLSKCKSVVNRLAASTIAGRAMFTHKVSQLSALSISDEIDELMTELIDAPNITKDLEDSVRTKCDELSKRTFSDPSAVKDREVLIEFLGWQCKVECVDLMSEANLKIMAILKNKSWGTQNGLEPFKYERWIREDQLLQPDVQDPVDVACLKSARAARRIVREVTNDDKITSFAMMEKIVCKKSDLLLAMDSSFGLELSWILNAAKALRAACLEKALLCLPTLTTPVSFLEATTRLGELCRSEMVSRSDLESRSEVSSVEALVNDISRGVSPKTTNESTEFYENVLNRCQHFFQKGRGGGAHNGKTPVVGKAAVDLHVAEVYKLKDTPAELSFHDVERVRGFWWLLSMQQIQQLQEVSKAIIDAGKTATVQYKPQQRVTPSTSSKKAKTAGASSSSAFDTNRQEILIFFWK